VTSPSGQILASMVVLGMMHLALLDGEVSVGRG